MCVSLTAFRLDELPSLVRQSKQTRRLSQSVVGEATLRLESELGAARRDSDRSARALEVERAKTARLEEEVARLEQRHDAARVELGRPRTRRRSSTGASCGCEASPRARNRRRTPGASAFRVGGVHLCAGK